MKNCLIFVMLIILSLSCNQGRMGSTAGNIPKTEFNITGEVVSELNWMNQPKSLTVNDGSLKITVDKGTDFFNDPGDSSVVASAPFIYKEVKGDFVVKALVQPGFSSQWNAVALMLHLDSLNWIKFAFENSDATGPGIVSVVTKGTSDDANGVILNREMRVWLAMARKGNIYSMHWSKDGTDFKMARLTSMPNQDLVKIGIEAQSPVGESVTHEVLFFEIKETTVEDIRNIN